ncbi:MAG: hypothetical protein WBF52_18810, partial [Geitlerinemataceae cyanobacterium]
MSTARAKRSGGFLPTPPNGNSFGDAARTVTLVRFTTDGMSHRHATCSTWGDPKTAVAQLQNVSRRVYIS